MFFQILISALLLMTLISAIGALLVVGLPKISDHVTYEFVVEEEAEVEPEFVASPGKEVIEESRK